MLLLPALEKLYFVIRACRQSFFVIQRGVRFRAENHCHALSRRDLRVELAGIEAIFLIVQSALAFYGQEVAAIPLVARSPGSMGTLQKNGSGSFKCEYFEAVIDRFHSRCPSRISS